MLKYVEGDLFYSPAQVLVNAVNTEIGRASCRERV